MTETNKVLLILPLLVSLLGPATAQAQEWEAETALDKSIDMEEWNNRIRREKFDLVLPQVMREHDVDMWIHVMRLATPDDFGAEELGSTSGVFVFTDRGGDRIERAIVGRRWGDTQRERGERDTTIEESGAYDIIGKPVRVHEPVGGPLTEYDYRFEGLQEFVEERDPERIAVNFKHKLGPWVTYTDFGGQRDGLSHTDYVLLSEELGEKYASRLVSSEYVRMNYIIRKVPSEIELLKKMRAHRVERVKEAFDAIEPEVTKVRGAPVTVFRRMWTGESQRGRSRGWEGSVVQRGDILAAPGVGMYAYVLREGETEPPPDIQKLWGEYLKIDKILAKNIRAELTANEIIENYTRDFEEAGVILMAQQLHMEQPRNDFPTYSKGLDPEKTILSVDCHGMMKGARKRDHENYFGPRIGSLGPDWTKEIPLPPYHHFVLEYFFYVPSPTPNPKEDQYLLWWDHESALATEDGVEYLSPPQTELYLVR